MNKIISFLICLTLALTCLIANPVYGEDDGFSLTGDEYLEIYNAAFAKQTVIKLSTETKILLWIC